MREKEANGKVACGNEETSHLNCWTKSDGKRKNEGKRKEKREEEKMSKKLHLLSIFYGDQTIGFRRSKRQSSTTQQELCMGTRIWDFRQTS